MENDGVIQYENLWRPAFEYNQAMGWFLGAGSTLYVTQSAELPWTLGAYTASAMVMFGVYRFSQAVRIWRSKESLHHTPVEWVDANQLAEFAKKHGLEKVWLGTGFEWKPLHTQRGFQLNSRDIDLIQPHFLYKLYKKSYYKLKRIKMNSTGSPWLHGLETVYRDITPKRKNHTLVFGITGSGKTRFAETNITQAIHAGLPVIYIDPKGDKAIRDRLYYECIRAGRGNDFCYFNPANPSVSVRIDPLKNWSRRTQIASRIVALLTADSKSDAFIAFAWRALNVVADSLIDVTERPNLVKLTRYIEGGSDRLVEKVVEKALQRIGVREIEQEIKSYLAAVKKDPRLKPEITTPDRCHALVMYYREKIPEELKADNVNALLQMYLHKRDHFQKMITNLIPTLNMLTSGDLRDLLSPDPADNDPREILDSARIISQSKVVYMGLDSLSDGTVGSAIGSIILSDLTSVAGDINNHDSPKQIAIHIDEAAEVINAPTVQLLNKSRGSGFSITMYTQTLSDFIARTGDEHMARQMIGNCGNLISLRVQDSGTQEFVVESFGETMIKDTMHTINTTPIVNKDLTDWSGGTGARLINTEMTLFKPDWLGKLPDLHFVSFTDGGLIEKGVIHLLHIDENWKFEDHWPRWKKNEH